MISKIIGFRIETKQKKKIDYDLQKTKANPVLKQSDEINILINSST
jgi:hypothetical protein